MPQDLDRLRARVVTDPAAFVTGPSLAPVAPTFAGSSLGADASAPFVGAVSRPADEPIAWYALLTRARNERKVFEQLQTKRLEAFLPTVTRWSRWRDRRKQIEWPLFPCYCFVRVPSSQWLPVLTCVGAHHVVSFGGRPAPVEDFEIDSIRRLLATTLPYDPCPFVDEGTMVEVTHGPLTGARGRLQHKGQNMRLVLAIEILGRAASVEIDAADVRPL